MLQITDYINQKLSHQLDLKPDYLNHAYVSGNKYRKLKYNLFEAKKQNVKTLLSFGGAYSNHIAALAAAGQELGFQTIGIIRGDELAASYQDNPTLRFAESCGMVLKFISRAKYRNKTSSSMLKELRSEFDDFYLLPEGGTNTLAVKGCEEILNKDDAIYDFICCPIGTGGTISGIINSALPHQKILGFPALKADFLQEEITKFACLSNWELITNYHFGGYAKTDDALIAFINDFKRTHQIPLDPIYTGKMMFGINDLLQQGFFPKHSKILAIHTGGLQGIIGMNQKLKQQNKALIV
ncbi:1-aminocyclopropane-1-carboxylate deaminase/D-cysteine desulfhydrase [Psychroserpens sp. BH13MA-6]